MLAPKYVAYQYTWGSHWKELKAISPVTFMADNLTPFSAGNRFWLIAENSISLLILLNCTRRLIPVIGSKAASLFPLSAAWLPAIS
jgi:hypothetical protein